MKRKNILIILIIISLALEIVVGTEVYIDADKTNLTLGDGIRFHLRVINNERIGGVFLIEKEIKPKKYRWVKTFLEYSSCPACGGTPLTGSIDKYFYFKPDEEGIYIVEANFGGSNDRLKFTVSIPTTTTSMTTTTTSTAITTTTTSTAITTTTITTPTTSTTATTPKNANTTSTIVSPRVYNNTYSNTYTIFYILILIIIVAFLVIILLTLILGIRR